MANFGIFFLFWMIFTVLKKNGFLVILGPPYCGIGATIRIGREMCVSRVRDFCQHYWAANLNYLFF